MAACTSGKEESGQSGGVESGEKGEKGEKGDKGEKGSRESGRPGGDEAKVAKARSFAKLLFDEKYEKAVGMFNGTMAKAMPVEKLKATWESIVRSMGAPKSIPKGGKGGESGKGKGAGEAAGEEAPKVAKKGDLTAVSLPLDLEKGALVMRVVVDKDGKVAGLFFRPGNKKVSYTPPAYVDTSKFKEVEVTVGKGKWKLPGTLTLPKGDGEVCGVVLVHGSGPHDRDETIPPNKPFRDLAWGLASKGVAVLRYEKRTKAHGAQMVQEKVKVTLKEEVVDDAVAAAKLLRSRTVIQPDCVFVAGHSLGANVSPLIGRRDPRLGGLILLAGHVTSLAKLALEQYKYLFNLDGKVSAQEHAALDKLEKEIQILNDPKKLATAEAKFLPLGLDRTYWKSVLAYDPVKVAKKLKEIGRAHV